MNLSAQKLLAFHLTKLNSPTKSMGIKRVLRAKFWRAKESKKLKMGNQEQKRKGLKFKKWLGNNNRSSGNFKLNPRRESTS